MRVPSVNKASVKATSLVYHMLYILKLQYSRKFLLFPPIFVISVLQYLLFPSDVNFITNFPLRAEQFSWISLTNSMAYGTRRFNSAFTRALQLFLSWAESTQLPALIPISSRSILILSSHLRLNLPKGVFPVCLPVKILKALLPSSIWTKCPAHLNLLDVITLTILGERYKLWSSSLWSLLHSPFSSWVQIFASESCFQIPLACIRPLM